MKDPDRRIDPGYAVVLMRKIRIWSLPVAMALLTLTAPRYAQAENLAPNPGFEQPPDPGSVFPPHWQQFSSGDLEIVSIDYDRRSGERCVLMKALGFANSFKGITWRKPVTAGERYDFAAYVKNNHRDRMGGSTEGLLVIEWKDASGQEITRAVSPKWDHTTAYLRWTRMVMENVQAPPKAVEAVFGVHLVEDNTPGRGSFLLDDVEILPRTE